MILIPNINHHDSQKLDRMYWVNGKEKQWLNIADRSVQFGDGCFTTIRIVAGKAALLNRHLQRLQRAVQRLFIPQPDWQSVEQQIKTACLQGVQGVLKVIITRGESARGYSIQNQNQPTIIMSLQPFSPYYDNLREKGLHVIQSPITMGLNPLLAGIKHLNRLEQVLIKKSIDDQHADEAIVTDLNGFIVEGCSANIFWRIGKQVFTPSLEQSGVAGIMREHIIETLMNSDYELSIVKCYPQVLAQADEVLFSNALMPIMPVAAINLNATNADKQTDLWCYHSRELLTYLSAYCFVI